MQILQSRRRHQFSPEHHRGGKMSDNVISINGVEHDTESFSDQQRYLIGQIKDLETKVNSLKFQLDQVQVAHQVFVNQLIQSVEPANEEVELTQ